MVPPESTLNDLTAKEFSNLILGTFRMKGVEYTLKNSPFCEIIICFGIDTRIHIFSNHTAGLLLYDTSEENYMDEHFNPITLPFDEFYKTLLKGLGELDEFTRKNINGSTKGSL